VAGETGGGGIMQGGERGEKEESQGAEVAVCVCVCV